MKAILMSIKPEWLAKILNGEKTVEIRKTMPKCEFPIDVYLYCTYGDLLKKVPLLEKYYVGWRDAFTKKKRTISKGTITSEALNGKIVAKFTLENVFNRPANTLYLQNAQRDFEELLKMACITENELLNYFGGQYSKEMYFWEISNLKIFDTQKELKQFISCGKAVIPPQSWQYIEVQDV